MSVPTCYEIRVLTERAYKLPPHSLVSNTRKRYIAHPRQLAMYLAHELAHHSLPLIGRSFGKDHTTVLYAVRVTKKRLLTDSRLREIRDRLMLELEITNGRRYEFEACAWIAMGLASNKRLVRHFCPVPALFSSAVSRAS